MKILRNLAFVLIFVILFYSHAFSLGLEGAVGVWNQNPSGYLSYKGDSISVEDELRYDTENRFIGRLKVDMPLFLPNIYFMYTPIRYKEDGHKDIDFKFGNVTFRANVPFHSEAKLDHYDVALYYGLPFVNTATLGRVNIDVGLNVRVIDFYAKIEQKNLDLYQKKEATIPIPMLYVGIQLKPVKFFHIEAECRGVAYQGSSYFDVIGRVKIYPLGKLFFASAGYRIQDINIDYADIDSEVKFRGPFAEIGFTF